ncbi:MAG: nucleotidyl transferase AbiEii/AbiGii toxin family protein, partial [Planctomycetota bacterium]
MTEGKPKNVAASVRGRLRNLARRENEDFQLVLTRYGLERLLYRLSQSVHQRVLVLKGAMLFQLWSRTPHRATRDVDFLAWGDSSAARFERI